MFVKKMMLAAACVFALSGCTTLTNLYDVATGSVSTSQAATTLAEAEQSATLVTQAVDLYVNSANPNAATLQQLQNYSNAVHAALVSLEQANAEGGTLVFATYNAALAAFNSYNAGIGITQ